MTKDEIKKALKTCSVDSCEDCPYDNKGLYCCGKLKRDALDLITEQEKEIDFQVQDRARLQREIDELEQAHEQRVEEIERLKAEVKQAQTDVLNELKRIMTAYSWQIDINDVQKDIDELIKEIENETR